MGRYMDINPSQVRSYVGIARTDITSLEAEVAKFNRLSSKISRSSGHFPERYASALRAQTSALREICAVFRELVNYIDNACTSIEQQDVALGRSINRLEQSRDS